MTNSNGGGASANSSYSYSPSASRSDNKQRHRHIHPSQFPSNSSAPFRVQTVSTMSSKADPDLIDQTFTVETTVRPSKGSRVRITLNNGQYFVLKIPRVYDDMYHEITSNTRHKLLAKFSR